MLNRPITFSLKLNIYNAFLLSFAWFPVHLKAMLSHNCTYAFMLIIVNSVWLLLCNFSPQWNYFTCNVSNFFKGSIYKYTTFGPCIIIMFFQPAQVLTYHNGASKLYLPVLMSKFWSTNQCEKGINICTRKI